MNSATVNAKPGDYVICDCFGRVLRVQRAAPSSGLGLIYRVMADGRLGRVVGL